MAIQILIVIIGYLLGSIPFGLVLTKLAGLGDIRTIGSGNIGATNVLRTGNKKLAALTLLFDGLKGSAAVLLAMFIAPEVAPFAGLAAMLGHLFPVWLKFKGGKGVSTSVGVLTALAWPVGITVMITWMIIAKVTRYSSLAALVSIGLAPAFAMVLSYGDLMWIAVTLMALVFYTHRKNIQRLLKGTEPKIGESRDAAPPA